MVECGHVLPRPGEGQRWFADLPSKLSPISARLARSRICSPITFRKADIVRGNDRNCHRSASMLTDPWPQRGLLRRLVAGTAREPECHNSHPAVEQSPVKQRTRNSPSVMRGRSVKGYRSPSRSRSSAAPNRTDRPSSPCPTRPRNPRRTSRVHRLNRTLPPRPAIQRASRR